MTDTCTISGFVRDASGEPVVGAMVRVKIGGGATALRGGDAYSSATISTFTDDDGAFSIDVPQGAAFRIQIPECDIDATGTAPSAYEATLDSIPLTHKKG